MQKMVWTEALYGTSDEIVDTQHQELFDLINNAIGSMDRNDQHDVIKGDLIRLQNFAKQHFSCEEQIMERKKCSTCNANKKAHHKFLSEFESFMKDFEAHGLTQIIKDRYYKFVVNWLRNHIMVIDSRLKDIPSS